MIQRRLYLYIVSAASLGMVLVGLANLGATAITQGVGPVAPGFSARDAYAGFGAVTLVGLPVWAIHWGIAQRLSHRSLDERASVLRRLYLYAVTAAVAIAAAIFLRRFLESVLSALIGPSGDGALIARSLWVT
ncbi:MAG TPA: DUF5671 domain-containing protein, partial [Candidatus Limnocylindrales bacterium]|nr:DUF5671 domain-containing protein [Candidatus Limnocylindrales bacterium]